MLAAAGGNNRLAKGLSWCNAGDMIGSKRSLATGTALVCAIALLTCFQIFQGNSVHQENVPAKFDSKVWKEAPRTDYGLRFDMADPLSTWIVGKSESDVKRLLGSPDWTGVGGILGCKWQPNDGSEAWNYSMVFSGGGSYLGSAFRIYLKGGRVIKAETVTIGGGV